MKLHLPKRLLTALIAAISFITPAAMTLGSAAWGEESASTTTTTWTGTGYEWKGGTGDIFAGKTAAEATAIWKNSENWTAVNCEFKATGNGPGTTDSNMWETIKIDGGAEGVTFGSEESRLITLEGWNPRFELSNGVKLYVNMKKWQSSVSSPLVTSVTGGSTLDIDFADGNFQDMGSETGSLTIGDNSSIIFRMQRNNSSAGFTVNLLDNSATMKFIGDNAITHTGAITVNSAYIAETIANSTDSVGSINLGLYADNVNLTNLSFYLGLDETWANNSNVEAYSRDKLNSSSYVISQGADGQYYVSYVRRGEGYAPLAYSGGSLTWSADDAFDDGRKFSTKDNVVFQTANATVTLGMNVDVDALVIKEGISVSITGGEYVVSSNILDLQGTLKLEDDVVEGVLNLANGSTGSLVLGADVAVDIANLPAGVTISSDSTTSKVVLPTGYTQLINQFSKEYAADGSVVSKYDGVLVVPNGAEVYIGGDKDADTGGSSNFAAGRVVIEAGGAVHTHTDQAEITSDWDLKSGATLGNKDKNKKLSGNIRFNIQENGTYNANGTVTLMQHWRKNWELSGLLSGQGNVELLSASREDGNAVYKLSGGSNDFSGAYILKDGQKANSNRKVILELANANAAKDATIKLNSTNSIAILQLDQDSTIARITSSDIDNTIKSNDSTAKTLNVTGGSAGFVGTIDSTITLNLTGGTFTVNGNITNNGKIQVATDATLNFSTAGNQTLGGTVELNGGKINSGNGSSDNRVKTIDSLTMLGTGEIVGSNWNVIWNVGALNGSGNLTWKNDGTHWAPSVLNINGGTYTGTLTADRSANKAGEDGGYQSVLQINSGGASTFTEGVVHLDGKGASAYMQMALNADQVEFDGLTSSNQFAYIFAGEATLEGGKSANICKDKAASTRTSVMSFNSKADTEYDFKGSVGSGISITKSGTGAQIFSGDTSDFDGTVTINAGTLGFTGTGDLGSGAITIASGAELKLGNSSADAERTLANSISGAGKMTKTGANTVILSGDTSDFDGTVTINAGTLTLAENATLGSDEIHVAEGATFKINTGTSEDQATTTLDAVKNAGKLLHAANAVTTLTSYSSLGDGSTIEVTDGTLNIGTLNALYTTSIDVSDGKTLSINSVVVDASNHHLTRISGNYFTHNGTEESGDGNGYCVQHTTYALFEGFQWEGNVEGFGSTEIKDGNTYVSLNGGIGNTFIINNTASYTDFSVFNDSEVNVLEGQTLKLVSPTDFGLSNTISGEGAVEKNGTGTLTLSGTNTYSGGTTISGGVLEITNASALGTSTTSVAADTSLLINTGTSGSVTFTSTNRVTGAGTMEIASGSTVEMGASNDGTAQIQTNVKINGGATLNLTAQDALGWGDNATKKITLLGSGSQEGQLAKLTATSVQTMKTSLDLQGNALVSGGSFEFFGGSITASGKNNVISSDIYSRNDGTITVTGEEDELEISGNFGQRSNFSALITKSGRGTLTISGAINVFHKGFTVGEGKVEVSGTGSTTVQGAALTVSSGAQMEVGANLTVSSTTELSGSMSVTGGTTNFNGAFTASGAKTSLTQSGTGVVNLNGSVTIAQNAGLTLNGTVGVGSTITNNGTLTFTDSITIIGELSNFDAYPEASSGTTSYVDDIGNVRTDGNGFEKVAGLSYWLTGKDSTGTVNYGTITHVSHGTDSYELHQVTEGKNLYFTVGSNVGNIFFVNEAGGAAVSAAEAARATGFDLVAGGNLSLAAGAETNANATIRVAGASTIDLAAGSTLNTFTKEGSGTITLTGSGAYDLGSNTSTNVSGLNAAAWTGTVRISSATEPAGVDLNSFGNSRSYLELSGVAKWLSDKRTNVNLLLKEHETESYGFKITGTDAGGAYIFNGSISGDGDLVIGNGNEGSGSRTFTFAGDLSEWEGRLILGLSYGSNQNNPTVNLSYAGSADAAPTFFSGDDSGIRVDENHAGTLTVNIGNAATTAVMNGSITNVITNDNGDEVAQGSIALKVNGNTDFEQNVTVTSMTVNSDKTATMNATLKAGTVTNNGVLKLGEAAEVTRGSMSKVQMDSAGITGTASGASVSNADVQIAQLAQDATFTIEDMTLTNTTITAASVNNVRFDNVTVEGRTVLKMQAAMQTAPVVGMGGSAVSFETSSYSGITLSGADSASLVVDLGDLSCLTPMGPGQYDLTITLSGFSMDNYSGLATGAGLVFAADSWLGQLLGQANNANVQMTIEQAKAGAAAVAEGGSAGGVSYSSGNVGTIITITGLNVPEPTTATLSLLALAALAARRRRNA